MFRAGRSNGGWSDASLTGLGCLPFPFKFVPEIGLLTVPSCMAALNSVASIGLEIPPFRQPVSCGTSPYVRNYKMKYFGRKQPISGHVPLTSIEISKSWNQLPSRVLACCNWMVCDSPRPEDYGLSLRISPSLNDDVRKIVDQEHYRERERARGA